jgi:pantoate--beta-alanine ligase
MGALHSGHLKLMDASRAGNDLVVASIFVNPAQFSPGEDLEKYPRTLESDIQLLSSKHVDWLFCPSENEIYPPHPKQLCHVEPADFSKIFEGQARPEFFRGVATIVCKLLNIVTPTSVYFGQKDISQCILVKRMVRDLNIHCKVRVMETVREADGLAMSSRNVYLSPDERKSASVLFRALNAGREILNSPSSRFPIKREVVVEAVRRVLASESKVRLVEYVSVASHHDMKELEEISAEGGAVLSSAIRLGNVRLIDNLLVGAAYRDIVDVKS